MAQKKLLLVGTDGVPTEHDIVNDDVTFKSFTVNGGGPVIDVAGIDMNNKDISDVDEISFTAPSTDGLVQTAGLLAADNIMAKERTNVMTTAGDVLFPVITDTGAQVDAFRLPALAGAPTASPTAGGEGYLVWDSTNDKLYAWDGAAWDDLSTVEAAQKIQNSYVAGEDIDAREVVYISGANEVSLAEAGTAGLSGVVGLAVASVLDTDPIIVQSDGPMAGFSALTAGARYYLSATPGAITATVPTGAGHSIVQVGYAKSATELMIMIEQMGRRAS